MTRSKDNIYSYSHDRHVARNGADIRGTVKKAGAGHGNWGSYADEIAIVEEDNKYEPMSHHRQKLVDQETFQNLRQHEQNS
ncbi:hypothetical protein DM01DRAFT_1003459 [Hesseltinella vesiculosa]|uniref:Hyaluronan/mRNA-binding protein domain-containing protein n=1 Tax=Hesseltinella vesiculosa TaxID=101127 RepID=A0A1X2GX59_9FUNG|nr:hypothetical protein DM01DRAFT_1003459 [Hesseltinella vesiculosa]